MKRPSRATLGYILIAAIALFFASQFLGNDEKPEQLTLTQFQDLVVDDQVRTATIKDRSHEVTGELEDGTEYKVTFPQEYADELVREISDANPPIEPRGGPAGGLHVDVPPLQPPADDRAVRSVPVRHQLDAGRRQPGDAVRQGQGAPGVQGRAQGHLRRCGRLRRGRRGAPGDQGVPPEPRPVPGHRRQDPQGGAALRAPRHGQDAARPRGRRRSRRAVLLDLRVRLRGDVRRSRRQPRPRPLRAGQAGCPVDHLRGRDRRRRSSPRGRARRRPRRARADAQPDARRDGRLRCAHRA